MDLRQFRLDDQIVLITGGTRGIGLAIARLFGEAGATCMLSGRTSSTAVGKLIEQYPENYDFVQGDVTNPDTPERLIQATVGRFGRLDILVNNAGVAAHADFDECDDEMLELIMNTNLIASFRVARCSVKPMLEQGGGIILNIGSISAYIANVPQKQVAYNASKAAVHQMTKSMASEYADRNIRVNALAPGYVVTDMTTYGIENPEWNRTWTELTPMGRYAQPEEIANCALFLCAPASSYVTGSILVVDGGYTTR